MNVDIYIREVNTSKPREIRIPWLPEKIPYDTGEASTATYNILNSGDAVTPTGVGLFSCSWDSIFPGKGRGVTEMQRGEWHPPKEYDDLLTYWKKYGIELNLLVIGYPINKNVYLTKYSGEASGGFGDIEYSIAFKEARQITVTESKKNKVSSAIIKQITRSTSTTKTYTVKKGDTLWGIAEKRLGSGTRWGEIYAANKQVIEATAIKYGRKSSDNGHYIYPGTVLRLSK